MLVLKCSSKYEVVFFIACLGGESLHTTAASGRPPSVLSTFPCASTVTYRHWTDALPFVVNPEVCYIHCAHLVRLCCSEGYSGDNDSRSEALASSRQTRGALALALLALGGRGARPPCPSPLSARQNQPVGRDNQENRRNNQENRSKTCGAGGMHVRRHAC